jgi:Type II secretion system (T2SS), protein M subtype b
MAGAMNRLHWWARRFAEQGGWPGIGAGLLASACALAWLAWAQPLGDRLKDLRRDNAQLQQRIAGAARQALPPVQVSQAQRLAEFVSGFPTDKGIPAALSVLHDVATRHGLQLAKAEFRLVEQGNEPFARYSMLLPVQADYASLRAFLDDMLREVPSVALEELSLKRDDLKTERIDARLRLTMFLSRAG